MDIFGSPQACREWWSPPGWTGNGGLRIIRRISESDLGFAFSAGLTKMPLPEIQTDGYLPPGIHMAPLAEVCQRFGSLSASRRKWADLLRAIVSSAIVYPTLKRVWGSFVSDKLEPADLDYSVVVSVGHARMDVADEHPSVLCAV